MSDYTLIKASLKSTPFMRKKSLHTFQENVEEHQHKLAVVLHIQMTIVELVY